MAVARACQRSTQESACAVAAADHPHTNTAPATNRQSNFNLIIQFNSIHLPCKPLAPHTPSPAPAPASPRRRTACSSTSTATRFAAKLPLRPRIKYHHIRIAPHPQASRAPSTQSPPPAARSSARSRAPTASHALDAAPAAPAPAPSPARNPVRRALELHLLLMRAHAAHGRSRCNPPSHPAAQQSPPAGPPQRVAADSSSHSCRNRRPPPRSA